MKRTMAIWVGTLAVCLAAADCVKGGSTVWTDPVEQELVLPTDNLTELAVRTHNGGITYEGQPADSAANKIVATLKGGGATMADAQAALEAIDVFVLPSGSGTTRIGWKWRQAKRDKWSGVVSFAIEGPDHLSLDGQTHNGGIKVVDVAGDVKLKTHNGGVKANSTEGTLNIETHNGGISAIHKGGKAKAVTHNGAIDVHHAGGPLKVETHNGGIDVHHVGGPLKAEAHNGGITLDFEDSLAPEAQLTTHNGRIVIMLAEEVSAEVDLRTNKGSLKCSLPLSDSSVTKKSMSGVLGNGEGRLSATTYNGGITIKTN